MLWRRRFRRRLLLPVTGIMTVVLLWQATYELFPNLIPPFFATAEAAYNIIQPDGDGTIAGTPTGCAASSSSSCIDDGVASSSLPNTGTDYVTFSDGQADYYTLQTLSSVATVTTMYIPVYHVEGNANMATYVSVWDSSETTMYGAAEIQLPNAPTSQWNTAAITSMNINQTQLDGAKLRLRCTRPGGGGKSTCRTFAAFAAVSYSQQVDVTASSTGNQQDLEIATTSAYVGGAFSIKEESSSRSITSITITEQGSVDAKNNLDNIKLYYELDTSAPLDCSGMTYNGDGSETQFGSTDTDGFSSANGTSTFTSAGVTISTSQTMCVYVVLDVLSGATPGQDLEIQITDPTTDIVGSGSPVITPSSPVLLPNTTTLRKAVVKQKNYHWRDDTGTEATAGSVTNGSENTPYDKMPKSQTRRVRFSVANEGNATSTALQLRLEYATKTLSCEGLTWVDVGDTGGAFDMSPTGNLNDGDDTDNTIAVSIGGVTDPVSYTFLTNNNAIKDTSSQVASLTLDGQQFLELEYAIQAEPNITDGTTYCFRVSNAGTALDGYTNYAEATIAADVLVDASSTEASILTIPSTGQYAGGKFRITDSTAGWATTTSITITASGTVDAQNDISNIKLRYDYDTSSPYTCDDVSYSSGDTQYGSTASNFNGSNQATFTGTATTTPTQTLCLYVEYDIGSGTSNGELLDLRILDPSTDVVIPNFTVAPAAPVDIDGVTTFAAPYLVQTGYHWRNNDGDKTGATSATNGDENTINLDFEKNTIHRLRLSIANTGLAAAPETKYRLEWAQKLTSCAAATGWEPIDTASDEWEMAPTGNLTEGDDTTDIAVANGGVSNGAGNFLIDNNGINDTTDQTASSTLPADYYLDLEYAIQATNASVQGATYCFRATTTVGVIDSYTNYAEAQIKLDTDFKIQRNFATMATDTITIYAGVDYDAPATASSSFIRITNTQLTGAGPNTGNSSSNADDVTSYIVNPGNIMNAITFARGTGAAGNTRISWEIVEYQGVAGGENEMIVRRQEAVAYTGGTTVSGSITNSIADNNDVAVIITGQFNADAGRNNFNAGLSTAAWNTTNNQADFTRNSAAANSIVSYALVEFTGSNWKVQRIQHTYAAAGSVETSTTTAINSLSRAFVHAQKRTSSTYHEDFGHEVWLSGLGQVSFLLDPGANSPTTDVSVAWIIENIQTTGKKMIVTRLNNSLTTSGTGPESNILPNFKTLDDLSITSLFVNNRGDEAQRSWPEPILGARLVSTTTFELWRSDSSSNINYRVEFVEWPTAARKLEQNHFRIYEDNDSLTPTSAWPSGVGTLGEDAPMTADDTPMVSGSTTRIRMTLLVTAAVMPAGLDSFQLEYAKKLTSCSAISTWFPLGEIGSTTAKWRGINKTPADGTPLSGDPPTGGDLLISFATVAGTYEEENNTALNPYTAFPDDEVEFDWVVQNNGADDKSSYCFRMVEADGTPLEKYNKYPELRTVGYGPLITNWRWYDDETSLTPTSALALENIAPFDIANQNALKLRLVLRESSGAQGENIKFALQVSEYADFSQRVTTLVSTTSCQEDSIWCYYDGNGVDNQIINGTVISDADACTGGVGNGCGTHNEGTSTASATFDHPAYASTEYEFTVLQAGARSNAVYYFRLYDLVNDEVVQLDSGASYPSLQIEGPQLVSTMSTISSGTTIGDIVTDVDTTPTEINFGSVPVGTSYEAAQRLNVNTNATEGYQLLMYATQQLTNAYGGEIPPVTGTNAVPDGWLDSCLAEETGCFGYHTTDATLEGGSGRFAPVDSYAALDTTPQEIMYSSIPADDTHDIVYRMKVTETQAAGDYTTNIVYITIPVH